ncbi:glycosyltransferase family 2 protein [Nisaea sediminum]|uniref:glycosyltransferase family 2 protein n=1 Tax=Nisaea sediminum TaxID=2775867 RepID=UPI0029C0FE57|nr:glycosyltransferase family 2 protein [Nisaea sediminum]
MTHSSLSSSRPETGETPLLSIIVPVLNEADNIAPLVAEIEAALTGVCSFEILYIDDASTDRTPEILTDLKATRPHLRIIRHDRTCGQSAGLRNGVLAARGELIATLDGDGQNDPADIPKLLAKYRETATGTRPVMITGHRVNRRDTASKRWASKYANKIRRLLLKDDNPDTGCSLKLYARETFLRFPYFDHMHRFLPALAKRENCAVHVVPVNHRHRRHGQSKYSNLGRALVGIPDLLGVAWLLRRSPGRLEAKEIDT